MRSFIERQVKLFQPKLLYSEPDMRHESRCQIGQVWQISQVTPHTVELGGNTCDM